MRTLWQEKPLLIAILTIAIGFPLEHTGLSENMTFVASGLIILLLVIVGAAFRVAHHSEVLARRFGEPYGTMILTLSAVTVEVVILGILMTETHNPTLARDTIYSAVMIDMNGIIGIAAIIGGIRHGEQKYNLSASNTYLAMMLVSLGVSMFIPIFIADEIYKTYAVFNIVITILLYALFLRIQTVEHRYFFQWEPAKENEVLEESGHSSASTTFHVFSLIASIVLIGLLSELMAPLLEVGVEDLGLPLTISAVLVALISASPEILTAIRAAARDNMQTVINIALGASLATVLLTVPIIELIGLTTGERFVMGLTSVQAAMLLLTILGAMINLHDGESNVLEGAVHFALFATFVVLTFL
jgi:Ca2+:H+ antiporter